ncbi:MAG: hypothetical protein RBT59_08840 [Arcobacteraceae bacterium]|jgi:hypothetical protein|nr:hypothetical protein [Arcobacteraceae bacterium]
MSRNRKIRAIVGTKGGVGKSVLAFDVLPTIVKNPVVFEIDSNNNTSLSNSKIKSQNFNVKKIDLAVDKMDLNLMSANDEDLIIDVGAGQDTREFLKAIRDEDFELEFYLPMNDDFEQFDNIQDTIKLIKESSPKSIINLVLNRCHSAEKEEVKVQFLNIFGNEDYGIEERYSLISKDIENIYFLPDTPIFGIIKRQYQKHFIDAVGWANDLIDNKAKYKKAWVEEGDDVFIKNKKILRLASKVLELNDRLLKSFK